MKEKIPDGILVGYNIKLLWSLNEERKKTERFLSLF